MTLADEVIVLAGGLGTRLRSVVPDLPKPLAPVAGRPFLAHLLDQHAAQGVRKVILAVGYRAGLVREAIGSHWQGMDVDYSEETEPLGTGGAVALAMRKVAGDAFHVVNGDTFLHYRLAGLEQATHAARCAIGVALAGVPDVGRYGAVQLDAAGRVAAFREKGGAGESLINAGSYFIADPDILDRGGQARFSFETDVLQPAAGQGLVAGWSETRDFIDIGVPEDYARAQHRFREADAC